MEEVVEIPNVFARVIDLGIALGWNKIDQLPGCQHIRIDERWECWINPHREATECGTGGKVPPFSVYFQFNGWPAGVCDAGGGWLAAGRIANEDALTAALDGAIAREKTTE
jgi:hypothetical protein